MGDRLLMEEESVNGMGEELQLFQEMKRRAHRNVS